MQHRYSTGVNDSLNHPGEEKTPAQHTRLFQAALPSYPLILHGQIACGKRACEHQGGSGISSRPLQVSVQHRFQSWSSRPMCSGSVACGSQFLWASLDVLQAEAALQLLGSRQAFWQALCSPVKSATILDQSQPLFIRKCLKVTPNACPSHIFLALVLKRKEVIL